MIPDKALQDRATSYEYIQKLNEAVYEIKEEPAIPPKTTRELKAEKDFFPLRGFVFPKEGTRVYWEDLDYPTKTFPDENTVKGVDAMKKTIMAVMRSFAKMVSEHRIKTLFFLLFFRRELEDTALNLLQELAENLRAIRINKRTRYCPTVREFYRVFSLKEGKVRNELRDICCMGLEYDDTYRYRVQNVIIVLDKKALQENTVKELGRLLGILSEREGKGVVMAEKWRKIKKGLLLLRFNRRLCREIREFLLELDINKCRMDFVDTFHARKKVDYKFSFHFMSENTKQFPKLPNNLQPKYQYMTSDKFVAVAESGEMLIFFYWDGASPSWERYEAFVRYNPEVVEEAK